MQRRCFRVQVSAQPLISLQANIYGRDQQHRLGSHHLSEHQRDAPGKHVVLMEHGSASHSFAYSQVYSTLIFKDICERKGPQQSRLGSWGR